MKAHAVPPYHVRQENHTMHEASREDFRPLGVGATHWSLVTVHWSLFNLPRIANHSESTPIVGMREVSIAELS